MSDIVINAESLSKSYRISHDAPGGYRTFREAIVEAAKHPFRARQRSTSEVLWAIHDVSFEVRRGEALGIIGRNGAGKSTLLKILSRITKPTSGRADVYGRLGSLLEVGTGFHPELTGRENVYLNGAILGMSRREIQRQFDEIVAFAETERFLDTPVKHYSTGMYMRLAFAVAAHLDTDVLVVDEVLAVGDAAFQQKCLGKMEDVAGHGRTVLFVSHNMAAITQLCTNALLLDGGRVAASGPTDQVIGSYMASQNQEARVDLHSKGVANGTGGAVFEWAEARNQLGAICQDFSVGDDIIIRFGIRLAPERPGTKLAVSLRTSDGLPIAHMVDDDSAFVLDRSSEGSTVSVILDDVRLYPGSYAVTLWAVNSANTEVFDHAEACITIRIVDGGRLTMRHLPRHSGLLFLTPKWERVADDDWAAVGQADEAQPPQSDTSGVVATEDHGNDA
ncbi:MAG: ABC transporter ATP-binding protein [Chloroflexota bacterium]